ncbi:response regulator, partial [candidate division KSB1 bacterium]|nr:response regulator [candidate division KSB1 bacterium]
TFEFAALNFRNPLKNQYAYKLEGFSDNWISLGSKHDITFNYLDPGEYTLYVKGSNNDNIWNEEGASIMINISPPWWKTGWAYAFSIILFGLIIYGVRRFELKRTHLKNELERSSFETRKLIEIDELKSRFFANISHEFRTPLTLILGPLQKLLSTSEDNERHEDVLSMQRNARRLQQLIDQLLDLSKIEAGRLPLRAQPDDIVQRIRECTASFVSLAESKNITLDQDFPEQSIIVYFDAEKLEKIIFNLLGNAFKFTPEGGRISIAVSCLTEPDQTTPIAAQITIADSGVGISSEHIDDVFDRFYSANGSASSEQGSTGIGLALTKEFVDLHHGEIVVESKQGEGSTFTISLPLGRDHLSDEEIIDNVYDAEVSETSHRPEPVTAEHNQKIPEEISLENNGRSLVLIVEDNKDMRRFLRNCLDQDFSVIEAENGESGYQTALKKLPDLIVSDVMMPQVNGYEFCQKIKTDERTSHIPIILLTARALKESRVEGFESGADDYVVKPFDAEELMVRAKNLIKQRQQLRERFSREITVQPKDITVSSIDELFLQRALSIVEENISNSDFKIDQFSHQIGMSRPTLNRKLRAVTGLSTNEFIRTMRLKRARQLLEKRSATIIEIAYEVGFNNPSYFAECFREQFGEPPSKYISH